MAKFSRILTLAKVCTPEVVQRHRSLATINSFNSFLSQKMIVWFHTKLILNTC